MQYRIKYGSNYYNSFNCILDRVGVFKKNCYCIFNSIEEAEKCITNIVKQIHEEMNRKKEGVVSEHTTKEYKRWIKIFANVKIEKYI